MLVPSTMVMNTQSRGNSRWSTITIVSEPSWSIIIITKPHYGLCNGL